MIDYDLIGSLTPTELLIDAGRRRGVLSIIRAEQHPLLMSLALKHSTYMADVHRLGHQGFERRMAEISKVLGAKASEIAAQSWSGQNEAEAANDAYKAWKYSKGHWSLCNAPHAYYGYAMVKGGNLWYSTGLFGDI